MAALTYHMFYNLRRKVLDVTFGPAASTPTTNPATLVAEHTRLERFKQLVGPSIGQALSGITSLLNVGFPVVLCSSRR